MRKRTVKLLMSVLCFILISSCLVFEASAANVTTVKSIPQSNTAALNYLTKNVGTINGSYTIPGLMQTVTRTSNGATVTTCSSMTPQGMCFADGGKYLLISAYCNCGKSHRSVIYVIEASSKAYKTTLILDNGCHVGGIACIGNYIWVCDSTGGSYLRSYKTSCINDAIGHNYWTIYTVAKRAVATTPSYLCASDGMLYVGKFSETSTTANIYFYSVNGTTLTKKGYFTIKGVSKIQGISIRGNYMVITSSYGRTNTSTAYVYKDAASKFKRSAKVYNAPAKKVKLANMAEACYIGSSYTYFLFESGAAKYRSSKNTKPLDKYVRFSNSILGIK